MWFMKHTNGTCSSCLACEVLQACPAAPLSQVRQGSKERSMNTVKRPSSPRGCKTLINNKSTGKQIHQDCQAASLLAPPPGRYLGVGTYEGADSVTLLPSD